MWEWPIWPIPHVYTCIWHVSCESVSRVTFLGESNTSQGLSVSTSNIYFIQQAAGRQLFSQVKVYVTIYDEQACGASISTKSLESGNIHQTLLICNTGWKSTHYILNSEHRFGRMLSLLLCMLLFLLLIARRHPSSIQQAVNAPIGRPNHNRYFSRH